MDVKVSSQIPLHSLQLARPYVSAKSLLRRGFLNRQPSLVVLDPFSSLEKTIVVLGSSSGSTSMASVPEFGVNHSVGSTRLVPAGTSGASTSSVVTE